MPMTTKMINRKGIALATLVYIILAVAAMVVLAPIMYKFLTLSGEKSPEIICKESVDARAAIAVNIGSLEGVKAAPLLCKTIDKDISGNKEEIQRQLADAIARCWWMYGEGRFEEIISTLPGLGSGNKGMLCYTVVVEENDDFKGDDRISIAEFIEYLGTTTYQKAGKSYLEYIQKGGGPGRLLFLVGEQGITPNSAFEIAFIEKKGEQNSWLPAVLGGTGAGMAGVAVVTALFTGGTSLLLVAATVTGTTLVGLAGGIEINKLFEERDVSSIMVVDMAEPELVRELHKHVASGDIAGR
jgi:hypothetical protein